MNSRNPFLPSNISMWRTEETYSEPNESGRWFVVERRERAGSSGQTSVINVQELLVLLESSVSETVIESVQRDLMRSCGPEILLISYLPKTICQPGHSAPKDSRILTKDCWDFPKHFNGALF